MDGLTLRQAAERFEVPKSTLHEKLNKKSSLELKKGPPPILSWEIEAKIVDWVIECQDNGFPIDKTRLLDCVQQYVKSEKLKTPFKNGRPGDQWYDAFLRRNPNLSERAAQNLTSSRASVTDRKSVV